MVETALLERLRKLPIADREFIIEDLESSLDEAGVPEVVRQRFDAFRRSPAPTVTREQLHTRLRALTQ